MKIKDIKEHQKKIDSIEKDAKCGTRYVEYIKHYFERPKTEKKEISSFEGNLRFKLIDYDTKNTLLCNNKTIFLENLDNLLKLKEKELNNNQFYLVSFNSDVSGKVIVRMIKTTGEI